jgi:N-acetylglucosamine-6-sulfatase
MTVDDMIESIFSKLANMSALDNTYVIYTSDNGYHISQHRLFGGKEAGLETDIGVPFYVTGPNITAGTVNNMVTNHADITPTILSLINAQQDLDGGIMPWTSALATSANNYLGHEHSQVEFWGEALNEDVGGINYNKYPFPSPAPLWIGGANPAPKYVGDYPYNIFYSVRLLNNQANYSFYYSVWCTNEHEFYDMRVSFSVTFLCQERSISIDQFVPKHVTTRKFQLPE